MTTRTIRDFRASTSCTRSTTVCAGSERITSILYQIHRFDRETPIEETLDALDTVVRSGKARYIGASSMWAWQFAKMLSTSEQGLARFVTMQNHYNLIYREEEREMIPLCLSEGIGLLPWSPLARGFLAGNRSKEDHGETLRAKTDDLAQKMYYQDSDFTVVERVSQIAQKRGVSNAQVALAWILQRPGVTAPIIGASKMKHLDDALAALDMKLDVEEVKALEEPYRAAPRSRSLVGSELSRGTPGSWFENWRCSAARKTYCRRTVQTMTPALLHTDRLRMPESSGLHRPHHRLRRAQGSGNFRTRSRPGQRLPLRADESPTRDPSRHWSSAGTSD